MTGFLKDLISCGNTDTDVSLEFIVKFCFLFRTVLFLKTNSLKTINVC